MKELIDLKKWLINKKYMIKNYKIDMWFKNTEKRAMLLVCDEIEVEINDKINQYLIDLQNEITRVYDGQN